MVSPLKKEDLYPKKEKKKEKTRFEAVWITTLKKGVAKRIPNNQDNNRTTCVPVFQKAKEQS